MGTESLDPERAAALLLELERAVHAQRYYPSSHPALAEALERTTRVWQRGMQDVLELGLEITREGFALAGGEGVHGAGIDTLARDLRQRGVRRLRVHRQVEAEELRALIDLLIENYETQAAAGGLELQLRRAGVRHITMTEIDFAEQLQRDTVAQEEAQWEDPSLSDDPGTLELAEAQDPLAWADSDEIEISEKRTRSEAVEKLTELLAALENCEDLHEYNCQATQIIETIAEMTMVGHGMDGYRTLPVLARHAGDMNRRSEEIREEACSRLRFLMDDPEWVEAVLDQALTDDGLSSVQAVQVLSAVAVQIIPALTERYERPGAPQARIAAILVAMGETAMPVLIEELRSEQTTQVRRAVRILGRMQNPKGTEFLLDRLTAPDADLRRETARALARIGTARAVGGLVDAARHSPEMAQLVAGCLGDARSRAALQALVGMLYENSRYDASVRAEAARSLGRMRDPEALAALGRVLEQRSFHPFHRARRRTLRVAAAQAIGRIGGAEASALLGRFARRGDGSIQRVCRASLQRMTLDGSG